MTGDGEVRKEGGIPVRLLRMCSGLGLEEGSRPGRYHGYVDTLAMAQRYFGFSDSK